MEEHGNLYYIFLWDVEGKVIPVHIVEKIKEALAEYFYKDQNVKMPPRIDDNW